MQGIVEYLKLHDIFINWHAFEKAASDRLYRLPGIRKKLPVAGFLYQERGNVTC